MTTTEDFTDLIASIEVVLNRSFQDASLGAVLQAVRARIGELESPPAQEVEFDENSLELGILQNLMTELAKVGGMEALHATSLQVH